MHKQLQILQTSSIFYYVAWRLTQQQQQTIILKGSCTRNNNQQTCFGWQLKEPLLPSRAPENGSYSGDFMDQTMTPCQLCPPTPPHISALNFTMPNLVWTRLYDSHSNSMNNYSNKTVLQGQLFCLNRTCLSAGREALVVCRMIGMWWETCAQS